VYNEASNIRRIGRTGQNVGYKEQEGVTTMAENKMKQVAKMFRKKLGEEFDIKRDGYEVKVKLTENGLEYAQPITRVFDDELFVMMVRGLAEIVED
jgi:hypothetical protein